MLKAIFKFKIIAEIISSANSADEVNSIAYANFVAEEMNENPFGSRKEEDEYEKDEFETKIMTTMMILNLIELRQKISISTSI
jgi:hypothetical protein